MCDVEPSLETEFQHMMEQERLQRFNFQQNGEGAIPLSEIQAAIVKETDRCGKLRALFDRVWHPKYFDSYLSLNYICCR